jgi:hypothetical protein
LLCFISKTLCLLGKRRKSFSSKKKPRQVKTWGPLTAGFDPILRTF